MDSQRTCSAVLFGPQATDVSPDKLVQMRQLLSESSDESQLQPLHRAVLELEAFASCLEKADLDLKQINVVKTASILSDWIRGRDAAMLDALRQHPNAIIAPLTLVYQILLYTRQRTEANAGETLALSSETSFQGLCVGRLAAVVAELASQGGNLGELAARAFRLAFCVGVYVDLDAANQGRDDSRCLVVGHHGDAAELEGVDAVLTKFASAYISVRQHNKLTITVSKRQYANLSQALRTSNLQVKPINLYGRYHHSSMTWAVHRILAVANTQDVQLLPQEALQELLQSILTIPADWISTVETAAKAPPNTCIQAIGSSCLSQSLAKKLDIHLQSADSLTAQIPREPSSQNTPRFSENAVAVVGMACKFTGADSLEELWNILETGTSLCSDLPLDRFPDARFDARQWPKSFKANCLDDVDAFDNKFFKVSSREAVYMDPQQRLTLQVTYQALESAGYFSRDVEEAERDVGCFLATCMQEYMENVVCHPPSAFSLTGSVRPFISGKVSHHFGWTGPAIMTDTACAASGTAVNMACRAVASGECKTAIAGGVNIFVSPDTFQNLSCGHFISATGASKSFDVSADGYCRGEGVAVVVLKKLSDAIRDGDRIRGVIAGTAVNQGSNEVGITVPHAGSQMEVYRRALDRAGMDPRDVTYVEAHGTGTQVGDPIEAASIRGVFGDHSRRDEPLTYLGSIKSNIGHTEATSGLSGLLKSLMMMEKGIIPQQALFNTLNPNIAPLEPSGIQIATRNTPWTARFKAACVNNYGASGTNATMIVTQPPEMAKPTSVAATSYPVSIAAFSESSLKAYCSSLGKYIDSVDETLALDIAYELSRNRNPGLPYTASASVASMQDLRDLLTNATPNKIETAKRPVVLFFGGQTGKPATISQEFYNSSAIFRKHLDECDATLCEFGLSSIFPAVFEPASQTDVVITHSVLFSIQYASAKAWIDCGIIPSRLIGHSFGQLTAFCVSGSMSLRDGLRLITGRAALIQELWGQDSGSMLAVEANFEQVSALLEQSGPGLDIACHNGRQSHVVAGSTASVDAFEAVLKSMADAPRWKRLQVSNAFHSALTEPLLPSLEQLAQRIAFKQAKYPVETCSDGPWEAPTASLVAAHVREPVYFYQAVERVSTALGPCTWLEAGSGSSGLLKRALGSEASSHNIKGMMVDSSASVKPLVNLTLDLWALGYGVQFWPFHNSQQNQYKGLNLPPYQFDKPRFWLEWKPINEAVAEKVAVREEAPQLLRIVKQSGDELEVAIDTRSDEWQSMCDHTTLGVATCPTSSALELVTKAIGMVEGEQTYNIHHLLTQLPLLSETGELVVSISASRETQSWSFDVVESSSNQSHMSGTLVVSHHSQDGFARFQRLVEMKQAQSVLNDDEADSIKGKTVYKSVSDLFQLPKSAQVVKEVATIGNETAGTFVSSNSVFEAVETLLQVPLVSLNGLQDQEDVYINTSRGRAEIGELLIAERKMAAYVKMSGLNTPEVTCDVFAFDVQTRELAGFVLDVAFSRVSTDELRGMMQGEVLSRPEIVEPIPQPVLRSTPPTRSQTPALRNMPPTRPHTPALRALPTRPHTPALKSGAHTPQPFTPPRAASPMPTQLISETPARPNLMTSVSRILLEIADVDPATIRKDSLFTDLGIDSLMGIEVAEGMNKFFHVNIDMDDFASALDVGSLCELIASKTDYVFEASRPSSAKSQSENGDGMLQSQVLPGTPDTELSNTEAELKHAPQTASEAPASVLRAFDAVRNEFDVFAKETGCSDFFTAIHPAQSSLITSYITEAFVELGCDLSATQPGAKIPAINYLPKHEKLMGRLMLALRDAQLIAPIGQDWIRTTKPITMRPTSTQKFDDLMASHPRFGPEHELLHTVGSKLAGCLSGKINPVTLLFGSPEKRQLMADQYTIAPIQASVSQQLSSFITKCYGAQPGPQPLRVLEIGGGTCGTTLHALEAFAKLGAEVEYTFTDISSAFISAAKSKLSKYSFVKYRTLDVTNAPGSDQRGYYDMIFATNVIHATPNVEASTRHIKQMLRPNGYLLLMEYTRSYYLLDVVFGQLDGWWAFNDGRQHALQDEQGWKKTLQSAGFGHVDWTGGKTEESKLFRIILGC